MSRYLLDANVLIALVVVEHEHHERASRWFQQAGATVVSPVVEGALVRFLLRIGESASTAQAVIAAVRQHPRVEFLADDLSYAEADFDGVVGHRQVTDAYVASLAVGHGCQVATFDGAFAALRPNVVELIAA